VAAYFLDSSALVKRYVQEAGTSWVLQLTELIAERYALRGYDAVQLASALSTAQQRSAAELESLTFISADAELNAAAVSAGLPVDNPNLHP
jgi:hypothetical protein